MRRARKSPRTLGRLRKSLNVTKRSLWEALLDAARAKRSKASATIQRKSEGEGKRERGREGEREREGES